MTRFRYETSTDGEGAVEYLVFDTFRPSASPATYTDPDHVAAHRAIVEACPPYTRVRSSGGGRLLSWVATIADKTGEEKAMMLRGIPTADELAETGRVLARWIEQQDARYQLTAEAEVIAELTQPATKRQLETILKLLTRFEQSGHLLYYVPQMPTEDVLATLTRYEADQEIARISGKTCPGPMVPHCWHCGRLSPVLDQWKRTKLGTYCAQICAKSAISSARTTSTGTRIPHGEKFHQDWPKGPKQALRRFVSAQGG